MGFLKRAPGYVCVCARARMCVDVCVCVRAFMFNVVFVNDAKSVLFCFNAGNTIFLLGLFVLEIEQNLEFEF